jgi:hypothetical protein
MHRHRTHPHRPVRIALLLIGLTTLLTAWLVSPARAVDYGSGTLGPAGTHARTGTMATADVALFGDSISRRGTADLIARVVAVARTLATDTQDGRTTAATVDAILAEPVLPPNVIMAAGSNDIFDPPAMAAQIARLRAELPAGVKLFWVDVQVARTSKTTVVQMADQRNSGWVNAQIHAGCSAPCVVVPWAASLASKPSRLTAYLQDGVHPYVGATGPGGSNGTAYWAAVLMSKVGPLGILAPTKTVGPR